MSQLPPDELPEDPLSQDGSKPNGNGSEGGAGDPKSTNGGGRGSHEPPTNRDLELPDNYNHDEHSHFIPSLVDLRSAAIDALDRETAFVILNHDEPEKIVERLDEIAAVVLAASEVTGEHQTKAIKLGLALDLQYWLARSQADQWERFITTLLTVALRLKDSEERNELLSRIYQAWSIYGFISQVHPRAKTAILAAAEWIQDTEREDIKLLIRAEHFNMNASGMDIDQALAEANAILADAHQLKYRYIQGRVYYSLSRACHQRSQLKPCFAYAQQALLFFKQEDIAGLEAQATSTMLSALMRLDDHSRSYCARLLAHLESLAQHSVNPWFQFMVEHQQAVFYYHQGDYEQARKCALQAWALARKVKVGLEGMRSEHMLGLIQTKRRRWVLAESHLNASFKWYREKGRILASLDAKHALAFIPYEQGDLARALGLLDQVLVEAQTVLEGQARDGLVEIVKADIEKITQELNARLIPTP